MKDIMRHTLTRPFGMSAITQGNNPNVHRWRLSRRQALKRGIAGTAGLLMAGGLPLPAVAAARQLKTKPGAKAKAVIQIWLWGGASHLDTFDPKPEAGNDYCGPFNNPAATNVDGIRICELLPLLAKQADKYS
ncbi:MAG: DUF1501 domain-containing protein, partial [Verrucomicrobiia bacterium]